MAAQDAKIVFYTHHISPSPHRVQIVLNELGLKYETVVIDLGKPREQWYLDEVNPRGLVPAIKYNDEIITESAIIAQFLADLHGPSHLFPPPNTLSGALTRARIQFFADTWTTKVAPVWYPIVLKEGEEKEKASQILVETVKKELEPLLGDAKPFFRGSERITLAEALVGPSVLFIYLLIDGGFLPRSIRERFDALPHFSKWAVAVVDKLSKTPTWDSEAALAGVRKKLAEIREQMAVAAATAAN